MDYIEKKKIRSMARKMLWADTKEVIFGWKIVIPVLIIILFGVWAFLPKEKDMFNPGMAFYFITWLMMLIYAFVEKVFNYLPLSEEEVKYYLKSRTNMIAGWVVLCYAILAGALTLLGIELFLERGIVSMLVLLGVNEMTHQIAMLEMSPGAGGVFGKNMGSRDKIIVVSVYVAWILELILGMIASMTMRQVDSAKYWVYMVAAVYALLHLFRLYENRVFSFKKYKSKGRRSMWMTAEQRAAEQDME